MANRSPEYDQVPAHLTGKERERARRRIYYAHRRDEMLRKRREWNRKRGHKEPDGRYSGVNAKTRIRVPAKRRYIIVGGEVYFSTTIGFTTSELRDIIKEVVESKKAQLAGRGSAA